MTTTQPSSDSLALTEAAAERIKHQIGDRGHGIGLRVGVRKSGCSGYMYTMDYADEISDSDSIFSEFGASVIVDQKHLSVLGGTIVDFRAEGLNRMFRFDNPKAQNACGCGESFTV